MHNNSHFNIINPYSQDLIDSVPWSTPKDIELALTMVTKKTHRSIKERSDILEKLSLLLENHQDKLADLMAKEIGKPITDGLLEIQRASITSKNTSQELTCLKGEVLFSDSSYVTHTTSVERKYCLTQRIPVGVVLAVVPFNFPLNLAMHKIAPAFAMGNSILLKPHPQSFHITKLLVDLCRLAGMNEHELQFIYPSNDLLQKILQDNRVDLVSFTGGTANAKILSTFWGIKKTILELGGNDALVIMPGADLSKVVEVIITQRLRYAGQRCNSPKRIFVHKKCKNDLLELLLPQIKSLNIGNPHDPLTDLGPVIHHQAQQSLVRKIEESVSAGARLLIPWTCHQNIITPVILDAVKLSMPVISEETFGPIISFIDFEKTDEVISFINSSTLGLQCGVFTHDIQCLKKFFNEVSVGSVIANDGPAYRPDHFPFGGFKDSGHGREGTASALYEYSSVKNLIF